MPNPQYVFAINATRQNGSSMGNSAFTHPPRNSPPNIVVLSDCLRWWFCSSCVKWWECGKRRRSTEIRHFDLWQINTQYGVKLNPSTRSLQPPHHETAGENVIRNISSRAPQQSLTGRAAAAGGAINKEERQCVRVKFLFYRGIH